MKPPIIDKNEEGQFSKALAEMIHHRQHHVIHCLLEVTPKFACTLIGDGFLETSLVRIRLQS
ncbi:hypothetical protein AKJ09_11027 [Labilithrix luteola]|uniref:Uncharacterized protein n=1 Tax=Labilithrix luteola TaxID=1391654 RepID=A0A0K1QF23_9BACT|nr:hypothetical protein AKJ09_11027 [Labilithrix luteola]